MPRLQLPDIPYLSWRDTKITLHLFSQIVGKIRLALSPEQNHWWHAPLYITARGLTTSPVYFNSLTVELEFDLHDHRLVIHTSSGDTREFSLIGVSVKEFYQKTMSALSELGIQCAIRPAPFDPAKVGSSIPFDEDDTHQTYDQEAVHNFWLALTSVDRIFKEFKGKFTGKCSPSHFFWHSFDLAVTRFSGRRAPVAPDADLVTREAYSHEVISAGFWPGDETVPHASFYCYVHPEPPGLGQTTLRPATATWVPVNGTHMALYPYDDFRRADDPRTALHSFLQSAYDAGAQLAKWPDDLTV